jgi:VCBS repeat-containing protein
VGSFTNGATSNIRLAGGSLGKKSLGILSANRASSFYFFMSGARASTSATNSIGIYVGDPDASGTLLTNIVFPKNWLIAVSTTANGNSAGTTSLSTTNPLLGGYLVMTSTFTIGSSGKAGLYACYPAVSNNWDASTFSMVSNTVICDGTTYPDRMVFNQLTKPNNLNMTNIATFRVINVKPSSTGISPGAFANTAAGALPDYIAPSSIVNYNGSIIAGIPAPTNSLVLTNYASVASAYTNTTVYFTNRFVNSAGDNATVADLICVLPSGFVYSGGATFNGVAIANPVINAPSATNYSVAFSEGYLVPANSSASLIFAATPTNALDAAGNVTNRSVLTTYTSYGIVGTNQIDKTYITTDDAKPTTSISVRLNPTAVQDTFAALEDVLLTIPAAGVLTNDIEPNSLGFGVSTFSAASHGTVNVQANGSFTYLAATNYNGADTFGYTLTNSDGRTATATVNLTVTAVNDPPSFTAGANQTVLEDAGAQSVATWATALSAGPADEVGQTLTFHVANNNSSLFSAPPAISATGTLTYTPAANANGSATVTVYLTDNGGTANGGNDTSATNTFTITVTAVNDPPSFTAGANQTVLEDAGAQSVATWATALSAGPADEAGQTLTVHVANNNSSLFSVQPAVSLTGALTYTPVANASGSATVTVYLTDNGGTANGGNDTSTTNTFTITVTPVNDPPTLAAITNLTLYESAGLQTVNVSGLTVGPANEAGQSLTVAATSSNPSLIPNPTANYISPNATGTLTFTPVADAIGTATVTVIVQDSGGTANGGVDSVTNTFTVTVLAQTNFWAAGSNLTVSVSDAAGPAGTGYTQTNYTGYLDVTATATNPFTLLLDSSGGLAANFNNNSNYIWTIATTTDGVLDFNPTNILVNSASFSNDLAGGTFSVTTNGNDVTLVFTPNHAPVASPLFLDRAWATILRIPVAFVLTNATTDPDGDPTALSGLGASTNGTPITTNSSFIFFAPTNNLSESFNYTIRDVRSYRPGDTVRTATNWITITVTNSIGAGIPVISSGGAVTLKFAGVPGYPYQVQRSTNLLSWAILLTTNAPPHGLWIYTDSNPPQPSAYYRLQQP